MKIIFVVGAPGVGKTHFSDKLAKELNIYHVISSDAIRDVMRTCVERNVANEVLFRPAIQGGELAPKGEDAQIYGFIEQAKLVQKGIDAIVNSAIKNNIDLILEGIHLIPGIVSRADNVDFEHYLINLESERIHQERIGMQNANRASYKLENFEKARAFQNYLLQISKNLDVKVINND